jgi:hypothetical protein
VLLQQILLRVLNQLHLFAKRIVFLVEFFPVQLRVSGKVVLRDVVKVPDMNDVRFTAGDDFVGSPG